MEAFPSWSICATRSSWGKPQFTHCSLSAPSHHGLPQSDGEISNWRLCGGYHKSPSPVHAHCGNACFYKRHGGLRLCSCREYNPPFVPRSVIFMTQKFIWEKKKSRPSVSSSSMIKVSQLLGPPGHSSPSKELCLFLVRWLSAGWPPSSKALKGL